MCRLSERGLSDDYYTQGVEALLHAGSYCIRENMLYLKEGDDGDATVFRRVPKPPPSSNPSLMNAVVQLSGHCCAGEPGALNIVLREMIAEVTPAIEFPALGDYAVERSRPLVAGSLDIGSQRIDVVYPADSSLASGEFNGYRLVFQGGQFTRIVAAAVAPDSHAPGLKPILTPESRTLSINAAGGSVAAGDVLSIILTLE
jgi:hypothetical protein